MALGLMASFGIVSCEAPPPEDGGNGTTTTESSVADNGNGLKIASLAPMTGDLSSLGQNFPVAVRLAVDTVNECGGVNDAPVTLLSEDTQTDPNTGSAA
ncbi:MAG: ABC transporter substrate-binding protein, partial [Synechococcaceae cyanobacterium RL_1_2]|nr:ABC transporter substrate-binding protein [Synechococcaceae cyanobacterium RL_1_2]